MLDYLTVHGFFLFAIVSALVLDLLLERRLGAPARLLRLLLRRPRRLRRTLQLHRELVHGGPWYGVALTSTVAGGVLALALAAAGHVPAGLAVAVATLAALLLPRPGRVGVPTVLRQLTVVLVLIGLGLTVATEYLVVSAIDIGRTNTVFKTYLQVWVLWGLAAAVSVHVAYEHLRRLRRRWRFAWRSAFVVLLACTLLYPALAVPAKVRDRFDPSAGRTLDGMAFMRTARYADHDVELALVQDLAGIRWMQAEVGGSPVVAEANTYPKLYGWGNRFAMFTGNPAIVGWDFHERQQRPGTSGIAVPERIADVQRLYATTNPDLAHRLLVRYGARYVVVGGLERTYFPRGQHKWVQGIGRLWEVAYRSPGVTVYRVLGS